MTNVKGHGAHESASVSSTCHGVPGVTFRVLGVPVAQGSLSPKRNRATGRIVLPQPAKLKRWRDAIAWQAKVARGHAAPSNSPLEVFLQFSLPRPVSVRRRWWPWCKPDLDKLVRAALDAMEGAVYTQDARVVRLTAIKRYSKRPGLWASVREIEDRCPHCGGIECDPDADCERREAAEEWNPSCGES